MAKDEEEFAFLEEQVMESKKPKRQMVSSVKKSARNGMVFGIVAGLCFAGVNGILSKFPTTDQEEKIVLTASNEPSPEVDATGVPQENDTQVDTVSQMELLDMQTYLNKMNKLSNQCMRTILGITTFDKDNEQEMVYENSQAESGVILAKTNNDFVILTRYSALTKDGIKVNFFDGSTARGSLYSKDSGTDLAVIRVPLAKIPTSLESKLQVMRFAPCDNLTTGSLLFAFGSPNGELYSMEYGYVTAPASQKNIVDYQMDVYTTSMSYHSRGYGIICNADGDMVGVISRGGESLENCTFYGVDKLEPLLEHLLNNKVQSASGITAMEIPEDMLYNHSLQAGIYVTAVSENSPAYEAGVLVGDVIAAVNGKEVSSVQEYYRLLQRYEPGERITMTIVRDPFGTQKEKKVKIKLSNRE